MPLILAATPIGDIADAPARLHRLIAQADVIAAEDTRKLRDLARRMGVEVGGVVRSFHEHNEQERAAEILQEVREDRTVLVVSDAGMPTISDPGYRIVRAVIAEGLPVTVVPGPSAVLTALAISGLATDRFCFEGFVPRKAGERQRFLGRLAAEERTMVFFESPHRIAGTLAVMAALFGADRQIAVCRELTKTYEEVRRGPVGEVAQWAAEGVRGEITIVVAGAERVIMTIEELVPRVLERVEDGERFKTVVAEVAAEAGVSKRGLYEAAQARR
ncbi:MAG TPA: 16S rRNA (cytidine(1402)-2'-O)-methyltransferase [Actinomycetales bacterium]|nr:16S rRNA (cytidine(1402)-2'-O)-methyltransferase [Actinomycetales bacterium]